MSDSLNDRRVTSLSQFAGNSDVVARLATQIRNGGVPRLALFHGPSGVGKTTLAMILGRRFFCLKAGASKPPEVDACGQCAACRAGDLDALADAHLWDGVDLTWEQYVTNVRNLLWRDWSFLLVDEAQDVPPKVQAKLRGDLENAKAVVVLATTHARELNEALKNRFACNDYELRRPAVAETVAHMARLCLQLNVRYSPRHLERVARHHKCDVRWCESFVYLAKQQTPDGVITDEFLDRVLGPDDQDQEQNKRPLI